MLIFVRLLINEMTSMEVELDDTVRSVKQKIEDEGGFPVGQQRLIFGGRSLPDERTLKECKVTKDSVLRLTLAIRGD